PTTRCSTLSLHDALPIFRVLGDHRVEGRTAELPALLEVEEVRHGVLDLVDRRPVFLDDAGELELGEVFRREVVGDLLVDVRRQVDRKSTRLNSSHVKISY